MDEYFILIMGLDNILLKFTISGNVYPTLALEKKRIDKPFARNAIYLGEIDLTVTTLGYAQYVKL